MYNKPHTQQKIKKTLDFKFKETLSNLKAAADKLRIEVPPKTAGGKPGYKEVIKQSVYDTAEKIYGLLMSDKKNLSRSGTAALRTKHISLAKYARNSERTVRRHINLLIEHGILIAKARLNNGIQLMLNPAILVFRTTIKAVTPPPAPSAPTPEPKPQDMQDLTLSILAKFSMKKALGST